MVKRDGKLELHTLFLLHFIKGNTEFLHGKLQCWYSLQMEIKEVKFWQQTGYCNVPSYGSSHENQEHPCYLSWHSTNSYLLSLILCMDPCRSCLVAIAICWRDFWVSFFSSLILKRNLARGGSSVSTGAVLLTALWSSCAMPSKDKERSSSLSWLFSSLSSLSSSKWFGRRWSIAARQ